MRVKSTLRIPKNKNMPQERMKRTYKNGSEETEPKILYTVAVPLPPPVREERENLQVILDLVHEGVAHLGPDQQLAPVRA